MIGTKFGRWAVVGPAERPSGFSGRGRWWLCQCECGTERAVYANSLRSGRSRSCGCLAREAASAFCKRTKVKHGHAGERRRSKEYRAWHLMKVRCHYPNASNYTRYGGRGIKVCDRWRRSFAAFLKDVGPAPSPRHSLGRKDNEGHYEPDNVEWQTGAEQSRNTRRNRWLTHCGRTMTIGDWAEVTGVNRQTIQARIDLHGWTVEDALTASP